MQNNARTHRSTPCAGREAFGNQRKISVKRGFSQRGGMGPAPYRRNTGGAQQRAAEVVGPYGKPNPAGAQRSARASVGEGWAGIGARTIPKRGPPPRPPRQRLAKRKARKEQLVKFSLCPIPSECSTAY